MKNRLFWNLTLGLSLLPLLGGCSGKAVGGTTETPVSVTLSNTEPVPVATNAVQPAEEQARELAATSAQETLANADAKPVTADKPLPANIRTVGPAADLIKLAQAGLDETVLLSFATNSAYPFDLSADEIIYLQDIGVTPTVVAAMIRRDQALKEVAGVSQAVSPAVTSVASPYAPTPTTSTAPAVVAPANPAPTTVVSPPAVTEVVAPPATDIVPSSFDETLSPYGTWIDLDGYGRCWQPSVVVVNPQWQPYFDSGHWVYTDCGWYWASDYSWGWAPFHYGRWFRHHRMGWCWMPDRVWGPSWVCWRYTDGYCGWAPLPPGARFDPAIGLMFGGHGVAVGFDFGLTVDCFAIVPWLAFNERHLRHHEMPRDHADRFFHQSVVASGISPHERGAFNHGVPPEMVARATHADVRQVSLQGAHVGRPGTCRGDSLVREAHTVNVFHTDAPRAQEARAPSRPGMAGAAPSAPSAPSAHTAATAPRAGYAERAPAAVSAPAEGGSRPGHYQAQAGANSEAQKPAAAAGAVQPAHAQTSHLAGSTAASAQTAPTSSRQQTSQRVVSPAPSVPRPQTTASTAAAQAPATSSRAAAPQQTQRVEVSRPAAAAPPAVSFTPAPQRQAAPAQNQSTRSDKNQRNGH